MELGRAVEATEAAVFTVTSTKGKQEVGDLILHHRPGDSTEGIRALAVAAFRDIIHESLERNEDCTKWLDEIVDRPGHFYCIVAHRWEQGAPRDSFAFISQCRDRAEADARLLRAQTILSSGGQSS